MPVSPSSSHASTQTEPLPGARSALWLLIIINLFNYIDRQILSAVLPRLQLDGRIFNPADPDLQFKLGLLTSVFLFSYMLFSPIVGWLDGHGYRRWWILGIGVGLWSLASGASGFAVGYGMLLLTRCCVGIGEGAYGPVASALLSDIYPTRSRGKILALFNMAIPVGSALGFVIGGLVSDAFDDWRPAFWITFSGMLLGLFCFTKKEFPRPQLQLRNHSAPSYMTVLKTLLRTRSFVICCIGMTAITYVLGGVAAWIPTYIYQRESRFVLTQDVVQKLAEPQEGKPALQSELLAQLPRLADGEVRTFRAFKEHLKPVLELTKGTNDFERITSASITADSPSTGGSSTIFGGIVVIGGLIATAFGAWAGDRLRPKLRGAYFWVIALGAIAAFPLFVLFLYLPLPIGWVVLFFCVCGLFLHVGPGNTIIANVVTTEMRATAFAINILVIHALGDVISPSIMGALADTWDWQVSFLVTSVMIAVAGGIWLLGVRSLEDDTRRAEDADATPA